MAETKPGSTSTYDKEDRGNQEDGGNLCMHSTLRKRR